MWLEEVTENYTVERVFNITKFRGAEVTNVQFLDNRLWKNLWGFIERSDKLY